MKPIVSRRSGFTLVELLVVIAIIVVLAAVGMLMANRMRKSADQAVTTANLRQIGVALVGYTADNGRFPHKNGGANPAWDRAIIPNLGYTDPIPGPTVGPIPATETRLKSIASIFASPADKEPRSPNTFKRSFAIIPWTCNLKVGGTVRGWKDLPVDIGVRYSILDAPERAAMVVQAHYGIANTSNNLGAGAHAYHDSGGIAAAVGPTQQVLFADGHVEKLPTNWPSPKDFRDKYWPGSIQNLN